MSGWPTGTSYRNRFWDEVSPCGTKSCAQCLSIVSRYGYRIIYLFNIQSDLPQNVYKYERMIASYRVVQSRILLHPATQGAHHVIQATTSEGLAKSPYVADRVGFKPATFRSQGPNLPRSHLKGIFSLCILS